MRTLAQKPCLTSFDHNKMEVVKYWFFDQKGSSYVFIRMINWIVLGFVCFLPMMPLSETPIYFSQMWKALESSQPFIKCSISTAASEWNAVTFSAATFARGVLNADWVTKRNLAFRLLTSRITKWSIVSLHVSLCVWVCVLHPETVSQCEKINETSVTGASPSAFAQMHQHAYAHAHPSHRHVSFPPTYLHTISTHFLTHCSASLHAPCTRSRILMCSLRALLSVSVTVHPSVKHFQPHHQIKWKQFSANSPFIQWFTQSFHGLRWLSISFIFHHIHVMMRH